MIAYVSPVPAATQAGIALVVLYVRLALTVTHTATAPVVHHELIVELIQRVLQQGTNDRVVNRTEATVPQISEGIVGVIQRVRLGTQDRAAEQIVVPQCHRSQR